jgi:hypothetical protein
MGQISRLAAVINVTVQIFIVAGAYRVQEILDVRQGIPLLCLGIFHLLNELTVFAFVDLGKRPMNPSFGGRLAGRILV